MAKHQSPPKTRPLSASQIHIEQLHSTSLFLSFPAAATATTPANGVPADGNTKSDVTGTTTTTTDSNGGAPSSPPLLTLENVQLLQPRGRFDLVLRKGGVTIAGKAGDVFVSWQNVRHIISLPRPEGFNWGKVLDPDDPAGSDLIALPLKSPVPFRKSKTSMVLLQPDPKAKHSEVSISVDGVSHQVSGSQGTLVMSALKLLSRVQQVAPDRGLFASRDGKSFVKCYHGVNEGSLFPLKQGLLFMKPALFLPRADIQEVVCGRGGSATTRYVDLVVGLEAEDEHGELVAKQQQEFSNIDRDALPSLQSYIQDALVAPRRREAKREAKAAAAAEQKQKAAASTVPAETISPAPATAVNAGGSAECAAKVPQEDGEDEEEEDDGDAESDEDFSPGGGGDADSNDDSDSNSDSTSDDEDDSDADGGGDGDSENHDDGAAARAEALRELDELAKEAAGGGGGGSGGGGGGSGGSGGGAASAERTADGGDGSSGKRKKRPVDEGVQRRDDDDDDAEDTESDGDRGGRPRKVQR
ncbi:unnamed protein product [Ectocarpus sp. CCAP 1310/34]|nr:unnamed protein product [Ectocarpus sp. CCAP 1310/34]